MNTLPRRSVMSTQRQSIMTNNLKNKQKKSQNPNEDNDLIRDNTGLPLRTIKTIRENFNRFQHQGFCSEDKIVEIIDKSGLDLDNNYKQKTKDEVKKMQESKLDFTKVCQIYGIIKDKIQLEKEEQSYAEYVDAFTAMGGNPDRTGSVQRDVIINTIKVIFELTYDIEEFMKKQDVNSDQLDFEQFCSLFDQNLQESRSIISGLSRRYRENNNDIEYLLMNGIYKKNQYDEDCDEDGNKPFDVNYNDFKKWLMKEDKKQDEEEMI